MVNCMGGEATKTALPSTSAQRASKKIVDEEVPCVVKDMDIDS
jgi:hypothetical protein